MFKIDATKDSISFSEITIFLLESFLVLARAPASSIKSIALSGKCLSLIYLYDRVIAAFKADSVYVTL